MSLASLYGGLIFFAVATFPNNDVWFSTRLISAVASAIWFVNFIMFEDGRKG